MLPRTASSGTAPRTVIRGAAPAELRRQYAAVAGAQDLVFEQLGVGADGSAIHRSVLAYFAENGYETGPRDGRNQGFFHGTGHGLGLEIHESPRLGAAGDRLEDSHVVTVEPGLYYTGVGGVRIEDVVVVRANGCENLTRFPKVLEL